MTTPGEKKRSSAPGTTIDSGKTREPKNRFKPNRNTVHFKPFGSVEMTKAEMYADLKKAVENTK